MNNYAKIKKNIDKLLNEGLANLFKKDENRFAKYSLHLKGLLFDYSKNYISKEILDLFIQEAKAKNFQEKVQSMFKGENINFTENRAVLHVALRNPEINPVIVNGVDYYKDIWNTFNSYCNYAENIRNGVIRSSTNKKFTDIVNIGIGGSYLPIIAAYHALNEYKCSSINVHFVANVDGVAIQNVLKNINAETALFIITSKTFTTTETMLNAMSVKKWFIQILGEQNIQEHFVAITTNTKKAIDFGIKEDRIFSFWDFVGGRFSIWSSVALPLVIAIGKDNFLKLLEGSKLIDDHFVQSSLNENIPFIMAILTIIYRNFLNVCAETVIPYCENLSYFPLYLQQVVMESNGKSVNIFGDTVTQKTSPVIFGDVGTNAQHSFFQMLHQGSDIIPVDFIGVVNSFGDVEHQDVLIANLIAQSEALMLGKTKEIVINELKNSNLSSNNIKNIIPHKVFEGGRPSNTIFIKSLNPQTLGMLYALYEHKVYSLGIMWQINPFDQFGVELGKQLARNVLNCIQQEDTQFHDSSTAALIKFYKFNKIHKT